MQLSSLHIDRALTNFSVMIKNSTYIADWVFPIVPVQKRSDKYFEFSREDTMSATPTDAGSLPKTLRRPGAEAHEVDFTVSSKSFSAEEYAAKHLVTDAERRVADSPLDPDLDAATLLHERLMLDNEIMVAGVVGNRSNYPTPNKVALTTGGSGTSWASGSYASTSSNPLTNIKDGKVQVIKGIAREANTFLLDVETARSLADHPDLTDLIKYTSQDALTNSGLPAVIKGLQTVEAAQQKNTAAMGASYSGGSIWKADDGTNMAVIFYRNSSPSLKSAAFGYTFEAPDDATGVRGISVRRWREDARKGDMIEMSYMRDYKLICVDSSSDSIAGYLITATLA